MGGFARALLSLRGRLMRGQFWLGFLVVFVGGAYSRQDQSAGATVVALVTLWVAVCVYGKRMHDYGRSAWPMIVPIGAAFAFYAYAFFEVAHMRGNTYARSLERMQLAYYGLLAFWLLVTLRVGLRRGQAGDNRFGPDPRERKKLPAAPPKVAT